jgi:hypothetical protein
MYDDSRLPIAAKLELDIKSLFELETFSCIYACHGSEYICIWYPRNSISCSLNMIVGRLQTSVREVPGLNLIQIANCPDTRDGFLWRFVTILFGRLVLMSVTMLSWHLSGENEEIHEFSLTYPDFGC